MNNIILFFPTLLLFSTTNGQVVQNDSEISIPSSLIKECTEKYHTSIVNLYALFKLNSNDSRAKCTVHCLMMNLQLVNDLGEVQDTKVDQLVEKIFSNNIQTFYKATKPKCIDKNKSGKKCERVFAYFKCLHDELHKDNGLTEEMRKFVSSKLRNL